MNVSEIVNIVFIVLSIILGFMSMYFKNDSKLLEMISKYISEAEITYKDTITGGQKFDIVVGKLYAMTPGLIRPFIPKAILSALVQNIFDQIDAYAKQKLDKTTQEVTASATTEAK